MIPLNEKSMETVFRSCLRLGIRDWKTVLGLICVMLELFPNWIMVMIIQLLKSS